MNSAENRVTAQLVTDSGNYLFVSQEKGKIFIIDLKKMNRIGGANEQAVEYMKGYTLPYPVYSMTFWDNTLLVGSDGHIHALPWHEELVMMDTMPTLNITIKKAANEALVHGMFVDPNLNTLFMTCSDNRVLKIDMSTLKSLGEFVGHENSILSMVGNSDGRVFTSDADGYVKLWPVNKDVINLRIAPFMNPVLNREPFDRSIGALALSNNNLVVGGGLKPALYDIRNYMYIRSFDFPGPVHALEIVDDTTVYIGGTYNQMVCYALDDGRQISTIPHDMTTISSIVHKNHPIKFMSLAGSDNNLHILKTFETIDFKIPLAEVD